MSPQTSALICEPQTALRNFTAQYLAIEVNHGLVNQARIVQRRYGVATFMSDGSCAYVLPTRSVFPGELVITPISKCLTNLQKH